MDQDYHPPPIETQVNARNRRDEGGVDVPNVMRGEYNMQIFQDPRRRHTGYYFKQLLLEIYDNHRTAVLVASNALAIIVLGMILGKLFRTRCDGEDADAGAPPADVQVYCSRFVPTDRVIVDVDLNATTHCHSSQSCAALAESLRKSQGRMRYNFILGGWGFVYVGTGFRCRTEEPENALYIRLPVDSILGGRDFVAARRAVGKLNELLREGLECSRVLHNFTIASTGCDRHDKWCDTVLHDTITEEVPDRGENAARAVYTDRTRPTAFYHPFDLSRVYNFRYRLVECTKNPGANR